MEEPFSVTINNTKAVLILIIMEDTHGVNCESAITQISSCLNPYYNGRYSWRAPMKSNIFIKCKSLNPYYNGRYSWSVLKISGSELSLLRS